MYHRQRFEGGSSESSASASWGGTCAASDLEFVRERDRHRGGDCPPQYTEQQPHSLPANVQHRLTDGGERRSQVARKSNVVESHDRDLLGHGEAQTVYVIEGSDRHFVAEAKDGSRHGVLRQQTRSRSNARLDRKIAVGNRKLPCPAMLFGATLRAAQPITTQWTGKRTRDDPQMSMPESVKVINGLKSRGFIIHVGAGHAQPRRIFAAVYDRRPCPAGDQGTQVLADGVTQEDQAVDLAAQQHLAVALFERRVIVRIPQNDGVALALGAFFDSLNDEGEERISYVGYGNQNLMGHQGAETLRRRIGRVA